MLLMPADIDIFRSAKLLIDKHGQDALLEAALKADELLDAGDIDGQAVWMRIRKAVLELLKPSDGETVPLRLTSPGNDEGFL